MPKLTKPGIEAEDASVGPSNVHMLFDCGSGGNVIAAPGIDFGLLKGVPVEHGKLVRVSSKAGSILIAKLGTDKYHQTFLVLGGGKGPDEMHIRIPIGVRFFQVDPPNGVPPGSQAFYFYAGDGYNVMPLYLALGADPNQTVTELVLVCSHVPPRRGKIPRPDTAPIVKLDAADYAAILKQAPPAPKRAART